MTDISTTGARRLGRTLSVALAVATGISLQAGPAEAEGAEALHYRFHGKVAEAGFYSVDPTGCIATDTYVEAVDGRVKFDQGRPDADSVVFVGVARYDNCTQQLVTLATGLLEPPDGALQIDRFEGAALNTDVEMRSLLDGGTFTMRVQLQWTGTGERERAREHLLIDHPGFQLNSRFNGTTRAADVSGVVSDGTVDYADSAFNYGRLSSVNAGETVVIH